MILHSAQPTGAYFCYISCSLKVMCASYTGLVFSGDGISSLHLSSTSVNDKLDSEGI